MGEGVNKWSDVRLHLNSSLRAWLGGTEQPMIRAWRGLCLLSSEFSVLHHGLGTLRRRLEGIRVVSGQCLSSSLHNHLITFYRKTLLISRVVAKRGVRACFRPRRCLAQRAC